MKYRSRHTKRDESLPHVRQALLETIVHSLKLRTEVIGIFIGGSIAQGTADQFSDIDLRVVVQEDALSRYIESKQEIVKEWGNVLFFEDYYPKAPFTIAHYDTFLKVDVFFYNTKTLQPSIWLKGIKILFDPDEIISQIHAKSEALKYKVTQDDVFRWRGKVFAYMHEIYRRVLRREYYYALTNLNNLRHFIVQGWDLETDRLPNEAWDWSKIEGERTHLMPWQLTMLESWDCSRNEIEIMKTLTSMIPELSRIYHQLIEMTGIIEENNKWDEIINQVL
ncbi:nucleotidyltransferase domain-containing protein [Gorillibacterium sp. sgz5001074]|uniref:nucleotidyltransferase domain-containing protein n=1 Tax=Gorillibacterium sp. sgz5001074 TaxID=3446695 RepID=UPI003F67548C